MALSVPISTDQTPNKFQKKKNRLNHEHFRHNRKGEKNSRKDYVYPPKENKPKKERLFALNRESVTYRRSGGRGMKFTTKKLKINH